MNSVHRKTLQTLFSSPTPTTLEWRKVETLFVALGAQVVEGNGSRVAFVLNNKRIDFHRLHPGKGSRALSVTRRA